MYQVTLINGTENTIIHYPIPSSNYPHLLKAELDEKLGQVYNFNFTIPYQNPGYNKIFDLVTLIQIQNLETNDIVFEGRIFNSIEDMSSNGEFYKEVIAESELAYLNDTITRAWTITNMSVHSFMTQVTNNHNTHTSPDKYFTMGNIQVTGAINCTTKYENSLNCLIDKMVNTLGVGYLTVRKENGIRYLDYLPQLSGTSANIDLGINMKDISFAKDVTNVATRLIPVGKDGLTIASVNNGIDYIEDATAKAEYGTIEQSVEFTDIDNANDLKTAAQAKLSDISKATYKLNTNILDLNVLGLNPNSFYIGTDTTITNSVINFQQTFTIFEKVTDLLNPQNCKITLNDKFETMTDRQISLQRISQYVEKILTADKQLNTFYLQGYINTLKNQVVASGAYANAQVIEDQGIILENTDSSSSDYGCLYLGPGIFAIANSKVNGAWDFKSFGTGNGFTADLIVAGHLLGGAVDFDLNIGQLKITHSTGTYNLLNANGLKTTHSDGSYSLMNGDGFMHYNGTTKKAYHYLNYEGEISMSSDMVTTTITLPSEFQGKDFNVSYSLKAIGYGAMPTFLSSYAIYTKNKNTTAGTFQVQADLDYYNIKYIIQGSDYLYAQDNNIYSLTWTIQYSVTA